MTLPRIKALAALLLMCIALALGQWAKPTKFLSDQQAKVDLETMFPKTFGDWEVDSRQPVQLVSPDVQAILDQLYNQVLSRTYVNRTDGQRIMLSVAYGGDQSDGTRAHRPEICYPAQGFAILSNRVSQLTTGDQSIRVRQLLARLGGRFEPISYWVTVGDSIALGPGEQKLAQLRYGIGGYIADGMLVRISNIDRDTEKSYALHQEFFAGMTKAMQAPVRERIIGAPGG